MAEGLVVLQSYIDSINLLPEDRRWPFFVELYNYRIHGTEPHPLSDLEQMALVNMFPVIDKSVERYESNKANGEKGGRPSKFDFIPPEEWQAYLKDHTQKQTAEFFGITTRTLRNWIAVEKAKAEKSGKNQDKDLDLDMDVDTDKDIYIKISKDKSKKNKKEKISSNVHEMAVSPSSPQSGSAPRPMMPGYEWVRNGVVYRINDDGEAEIIGKTK